MNRNRVKTAGIMIIGNEILSGKVRDRNSFYLAGELRALGISVMKITVLPDEVDTIGSEVADCAGRFDYVFTTGGVGPTHDDVTMAAIAAGFGVKLVSNPSIKRAFEERCGEPLNAAIMKMTEVPEGAEIIGDDDVVFPVLFFRNVFVFPGIPEHLQMKFPLIRERLRSGVFYLKRIFVNTRESQIAETLNSVVARNPDVNIGSYPVTGDPGYKVIITAESVSEQSLLTAVDELVRKLSGTAIVVGTE
jgi:molybdenum cofactor synthesis domain-containing protein